ncbi:molybdate ABC transporter substrate-binding protein [Paracoccus sp. p3-h83]|uniref:molybdate ABC transporter substrate-binding protein n=1 Tax=Paracoccus sp. p3-h83 TaxID=3342805 RepID=UPI0035B8890B
MRPHQMPTRSLRHALILALPLALTALPALADEVVVFAAASLKTALDPIAAEVEKASGHQIRISYAGSNALARQILQGAPAGVFISASSEWMDAVDQAGAVVPGSRRDLLGNRLVLIAHDPGAAIDLGPKTDLRGLLAGDKLAMALVDSVPAGQYGKQALQHLGLWDAVAPDVAQADNVRAALTLVSTGEAPLGIVYATDAAADPAVHLRATFPADSHDPITYPAALLTGAGPAERAFFDALTGPAAAAVFAAQGFTVLDPTP